MVAEAAEAVPPEQQEEDRLEQSLPVHTPEPTRQPTMPTLPRSY